MNIDDVAAFPISFVAYTNMHPTHFRSTDAGRFVGCVSASAVGHSSARSLFPTVAFQDGAVIIHNLCVADAYRKHGVGKRLIRSVMNKVGPSAPLYLCISKGGGVHNEDIDAVFCDRVARLRSTYARLGFAQEQEAARAVLMRYRPSGTL